MKAKEIVNLTNTSLKVYDTAGNVVTIEPSMEIPVGSRREGKFYIVESFGEYEGRTDLLVAKRIGRGGNGEELSKLYNKRGRTVDLVAAGYDHSPILEDYPFRERPIII